jgi:hypothetical protein
VELLDRLLRPISEVAAGSQAVLKRGPIRTGEVTEASSQEESKQGFYAHGGGLSCRCPAEKDVRQKKNNRAEKRGYYSN